MTWESGFDSVPLGKAVTARERAKGSPSRCVECRMRPNEGDEIELTTGETESGVLVAKIRCIPCADAFIAACQLDDMVAPPALGALWPDLEACLNRGPSDETVLRLLVDLRRRCAQGEAEVRFEENRIRRQIDDARHWADGWTDDELKRNGRMA